MSSLWAPGIAISDAPIRKVIRRSSPNTNGWHRTKKNPIGYAGGESPGELEFIFFAEMDPNVTVIRAQPCAVPYTHEGKARTHIPDFAVVERGESVIYEGKSLRQYEKPKLQLQLRSAARSVETWPGWSYYVALKQEILEDPRYRNVYAVWRYLRPRFDTIMRLAVEETLSRGERIATDVVRDLAAAMGDRAPSFEDILSLAANGHIFIDWENPVGPASVIRRADPASLPTSLLPRRRPADDLPWEITA